MGMKHRQKRLVDCEESLFKQTAAIVKVQHTVLVWLLCSKLPARMEKNDAGMQKKQHLWWTEDPEPHYSSLLHDKEQQQQIQNLIKVLRGIDAAAQRG